MPAINKQNHNTLVIVWVFFTATMSFAPASAAQSLWQKRDSQKAFLFYDQKARNVGDILTVMIAENTDVANSDTRGLNKSSSAGSAGDFSFDGNGTSGSATAQFGTSAQRQFDGDVNYSSEREFTDRFSVTVIDVLPNGNLVIAGTREIFVEGDKKTLKLSGIVRGLDIRADNSVLSRHISNVQLKFHGAGPEASFINQGWLNRRINKWWPF